MTYVVMAQFQKSYLNLEKKNCDIEDLFVLTLTFV